MDNTVFYCICLEDGDQTVETGFVNPKECPSLRWKPIPYADFMLDPDGSESSDDLSLDDLSLDNYEPEE